MQTASIVAVADTTAYLTAVACAERRAFHSYFDQHVIEDERGYVVIDEGDYNALPMTIIDRIIHTAPGGMHDEY